MTAAAPEEVTKMVRDATQALLDILPAGVGFVLITMDSNDEGCTTFSSNVERPSAIVMLNDMIGQLKADLS